MNESIEINLESNPVVSAIKRVLEDQKRQWEGTVSDLLNEAGLLIDEKILYSREWPKTPKALSAALHRVAPFLRQPGININFRRSHGKNLIFLSVVQEGSGTTYTTCTTYTPNEQLIDNEELTSWNCGVRPETGGVHGVCTLMNSVCTENSTYTRQVEQNQKDAPVGVEGT